MENLPAIQRHLILGVLTVLISWGGTDLVPWLRGQTGWGALLGLIVAALLAGLTPLVQSYGLFKTQRWTGPRSGVINYRGVNYYSEHLGAGPR